MSHDHSNLPPAVTAVEAIGLAPETFLLDVREQVEWDGGHAPTAVHLPMSQLGERLEELPTDRRMLVICQIGGRSQRVAGALIARGFDAVNVLGGMDAWQSAGGEIVAGGPESPLA